MTSEIREFPFGENKEAKAEHYTDRMLKLTEYHRKMCDDYRKILAAAGYDAKKVKHYKDIPFLPVGIFKELRLSSIEDDSNIKTVTSSGTSGQARSQIILDAETRVQQQQALAAIGADFLGKKRLPMLVIDCPATIEKRDRFSARTSGILGFSIFAKKRVFALNDDMSLNMEAVEEFVENYSDGPVLIFGFTFMVWRYFVQELEKQNKKIDLPQAVLVHGGGWKKLISEAVSKQEFADRLKKTCGVNRVMDYYGMAEQTGSIFMECEYGHLHCSDYSAVLFRRAKDFSLCEKGEEGLIQVMSTIPKSYPGHSLLTEDIGRMIGEDDCPCGRKGVYFEVIGRAQHAEIRGCSDTFAAEH